MWYQVNVPCSCFQLLKKTVLKFFYQACSTKLSEIVANQRGYICGLQTLNLLKRDALDLLIVWMKIKRQRARRLAETSKHECDGGLKMRKFRNKRNNHAWYVKYECAKTGIDLTTSARQYVYNTRTQPH